jgi:hypothetical protein
LDYVACLNKNNYLGHNDWRLPNRKELRSLIHYGQGDMTVWLNEHGFSNVQSDHYWSSTTYPLSQVSAWSVNMVSGEMIEINKDHPLSVLPVRGGTVIIVDTTAPVLDPVANKTVLWPPNHKMVDITLWANASDNSGGLVQLEAKVSSNEPQSGLGGGDKSPDWTEPVIDQLNGIITLQLRAERAGSGNGRIYTITLTGRDASGNSSQANVEIFVPHDMGK